MIHRQTASLLKKVASEFKAVAIVGPRQSGKTTLARAVFPEKPYVNLEEPDMRRFVTEDPRRFLKMHESGAVIDEAQRCPELFSYLQTALDSTPHAGRFILTGSQHFNLMENITQSLAGRIGFLRLLPFSFTELVATDRAPTSLDMWLFNGGYPPLYDGAMDTVRWLNAYISSYVERDVRQLLNIHNLASFDRFVRLCAGHVGQLVNLQRIGMDAGVDQKTAAAWMGLLEASFIAFRLRPHHQNFSKRIVKTPKLYFYDTGLAIRLSGVTRMEDLAIHPMRGAWFENAMIVELLKSNDARGVESPFYFWRSHDGYEVDLVIDEGGRLTPVEFKSGSTPQPDWFATLGKWSTWAGKSSCRPTILYGGDEVRKTDGGRLLPWRKAQEVV